MEAYLSLVLCALLLPTIMGSTAISITGMVAWIKCQHILNRDISDSDRVIITCPHRIVFPYIDLADQVLDQEQHE